MPNLSPEPITTTPRLIAYRERILRVLKNATPLMTYYATDHSDPKEIVAGFTSKDAYAVKVYPAGATTNSDQGVTDIQKIYPLFAAMQDAGMPALFHGEMVQDAEGNDIPLMDREKVFLETIVPKLLKDFPALKIVLEHATTKDAVDFIQNENSPRLAATVTAHHLISYAEDHVEDRLKPYAHCLPVVKSKKDRDAVRKAATSGSPHFFLGTDSAPHPVSKKEEKNYPGGMFTTPAALELYLQVFEEENAIHNFETFASLSGPAFYGLPINTETITLEKNPWTIDEMVALPNGDAIRPFGYHEDPDKRLVLQWKLQS